MKNVRFNVVGLILLMVGLLIFTTRSTVEASSYLGVVCWNASVGGQIGGNLKLAVTDMGDGHYIVNGTSTNTSTSAVEVVHGNAEVVSNKIILTLNSSHTDQYATSISTSNISLDIPSLNGVFNSISQDYNYSQGAFEPLNYTTGVVTLIPCP